MGSTSPTPSTPYERDIGDVSHHGYRSSMVIDNNNHTNHEVDYHHTEEKKKNPLGDPTVRLAGRDNISKAAAETLASSSSMTYVLRDYGKRIKAESLPRQEDGLAAAAPLDDDAIAHCRRGNIDNNGLSSPTSSSPPTSSSSSPTSLTLSCHSTSDDDYTGGGSESNVSSSSSVTTTTRTPPYIEYDDSKSNSSKDVVIAEYYDTSSSELMDDIDIEELLLLQDVVDDPVCVRRKDKRSFFIGVCDFAFTSMLLAGAPSIYPIYYTIKLIILMPFRFITYYKRKWHFYMLDFCYFGNILVLYYYWIMPYSYILFIITYALVTGPLAWAVLVFRNSLVFHSIDKITSCFIHLGPLFMVTLLRWHPDDMSKVWYYLHHQEDGMMNMINMDHTTTTTSYNQYFAVTLPSDTNGNTSSSSLFLLLIVVPILVYLIHLLLYGFVTHYIFHIQGNNSEYATSYSHLVSLHGDFLKRCSKYITDDNMWLWYGIAQIVLTSVTILSSFIWYNMSEWVNYLLCVACFMVTLWNGANFYVEVFARKHIRSLQREKTLRKDDNKKGSCRVMITTTTDDNGLRRRRRRRRRRRMVHNSTRCGSNDDK